METITKDFRLYGSYKRTEQPKRLSKIGQWRRDNPGGIIEVLDRRAVNK